MGKKFKKIAAFLLAFAMVGSVLTGCRGGSKKEDPGGGKQEPTAEPLKKVTISILKSRDANEVEYGKMETFKIAEEKTGVHVEWDNPDESKFLETLNLVLASGNLPDVIMDLKPPESLLKYAQQGSFIPLNELIEKNAPNLNSWFTKMPDVKKTITSYDGKIYYFPKFSESPKGNTYLGVRKDWLDRLNLKAPVTTEDWYAVWKAFKERDPNGNGKQDEIPFSANGWSRARSLAIGWGVHDTFYVDPKDNNKIKYGPTEGKYKEALIWIAKAYKEGLIDKDIGKNSNKQFQDKMGQNIVGSFRGVSGSHFTTFNGTLPDKIPGFKVIGTPPLKGPDGLQLHEDVTLPVDDLIAAVISNKNKYPVETVKWMDFMYGKEGANYLNFGFEGKTYTMQNGKVVFTDYLLKNPDGLSQKQVFGTFSYRGSTGPMVAIESDPRDETTLQLYTECLNPYLEESRKYKMPVFSMSPEDSDSINKAMTDITAYVDETIAKFIQGQESFDNWDKYVAKVKSMGLDKVLSTYQKNYDQYKSRK